MYVYIYIYKHKNDGISWVRETFTDKSTNTCGWFFQQAVPRSLFFLIWDAETFFLPICYPTQ